MRDVLLQGSIFHLRLFSVCIPGLLRIASGTCSRISIDGQMLWIYPRLLLLHPPLDIHVMMLYKPFWRQGRLQVGWQALYTEHILQLTVANRIYNSHSAPLTRHPLYFSLRTRNAAERGMWIKSRDSGGGGSSMSRCVIPMALDLSSNIGRIVSARSCGVGVTSPSDTEFRARHVRRSLMR